MKHLRLIIASVCLGSMLFTSGCGHKKHEKDEQTLTPMPMTQIIDPDDDVMMLAIQEYIVKQNAPANSRYEFTRLDLNADNRREALVMMKAPHQYWCGIHGCKMIIMRAHNEGFSIVSEISPLRGPVLISDNTTNDWRDIYVLIDGRTGWPRKEVMLNFDGASYPTQPAFLRPQENLMSQQGVRIFP